jgi:hypothetical protein
LSAVLHSGDEAFAIEQRRETRHATTSTQARATAKATARPTLGTMTPNDS